MKSRMLFSILVVAVTAFSIQAQPPGGRGARGGFGGEIGDTIADILVLTNGQAKAVSEKMNAVQQELRDEMRGNFQRGGGDDMRARMQEMRETMQAKLIEELKTVLSENDVETLEPLINSGRGGRGTRAYAPVRAIRQIDLEDTQRASIRTETVALYTTLLELMPEQDRQSGRGQGRRGQGEPGGLDGEIRAKIESVRAAYLEKVVALLTDAQLTPWETKITEIEAELESQRGQRGQRGGGQGGQGRRGGN